MSIIDTLITDRSQSDVDRALTLSAKGWAAMTAAEKEEFVAGMKGSYDATDLNRVNAAMEYLEARFKAMGYTGGYYQKVEVPHKQSGGGSVLPEGYTQVEYIQSDGNQYVDTGLKPNQDTRVVMDVQSLGTGTNPYFGARTAAGQNAFVLWILSATSLRSDYGANNLTQTVDSVTNRVTIDKNKNVCTYGSYTITNITSTFSCPQNLLLLAQDTGGEIDTRKLSAILYSCQVYDNGTLARNYIPCSNAENDIGLYDTVEKQFYGNAGTGAFTAGPEVTTTVTPPEPEEELGPYTWYKEDIPTPETMEGYLGNVQRLRDALGVIPTTPEVPDSMEYSTIQEWNDIETILIDVEKVIDALSSVFQRAGMPWAVAGNNFYFRN